VFILGTDLFAAGNLVVNGQLQVGSTAYSPPKLYMNSSDKAIGLYIDVPDQGSAGYYGARYSMFMGGTSGTTSGYGVDMAAHLTTNGASVNQIMGANYEVRLAAAGATTINDFIANRVRFSRTGANTASHTATNVAGIFYEVAAPGGSGTVNATNYWGLYMSDNNTLFTGTTHSQIWLDKITGGTTNYGLVLNGDGIGADIVFGSSQQVKMYRDAGGQLYITGATVCDQSCISDIKYKNNIMPIESSLDKIMKIQGVSYTWDSDKYEDMYFPEGTNYGIVAQEIEKVLPEVVREDSRGNKSVAYKQLIPFLVEAMKEQQNTISYLTEEVKELKKEIKNNSSLAVN
jgi:hypothetical protein